MQSRPTPRPRTSGALLIASGMTAALGCSSPYEPDGQFWPGWANGAAGGVSASPGDDADSNSSTSAASADAAGEGSESSRAAADDTSTAATVADSPTCSLGVSVTTTAPGGRYRPRNVGAIWIADSSGRFVKSLDVWGNRRLNDVTAWLASTRAAGVTRNRVDAVTAATLPTHRTHGVTWNCRDFGDLAVPDGTYRVYFEVSDRNGSGPNHFESFTKGPRPGTVQGRATNFNGIFLGFQP